MPRTTYVMRDGQLVDKSLLMASSDAPYVISDTMDPTRHMADGNYYTSKSKFRETTKAHGCIEYGNENLLKPRKPVKLDRQQRRDDIRKAIQDLKYNRVNKNEWHNYD